MQHTTGAGQHTGGCCLGIGQSAGRHMPASTAAAAAAVQLPHIGYLAAPAF